MTIDFDARAADGSPEPEVARAPEILHGLGSIVENAIAFATSRVEIATEWDRRKVRVLVTDDGPGFDPAILGELGEPYLSRRAESGHVGLGVFIARTLLERTGATLTFRNRAAVGRGGSAADSGGAEVAIRWQRVAIDLGEPPQ